MAQPLDERTKFVFVGVLFPFANFVGFYNREQVANHVRRLAVDTTLPEGGRRNPHSRRGERHRFPFGAGAKK
jgi:hypothetical protein